MTNTPAPEFTTKHKGDFVQHRLSDNYGRVVSAPHGWTVKVQWDHDDTIGFAANSDLLLVTPAH